MSTPKFSRAQYTHADGTVEVVHLLKAEQFIPVPIEKVFDYFRNEKNLESLTPSLLNFHVLGMDTPEMGNGTHIEYRLKVHGIPMKWRTRIGDWNPPHLFSDYQEKGPYRLWHHFHRLSEVENGTLMRDEVYFKLPFGILGDLFAGPFVKKDVRSIFTYRYDRIEELVLNGTLQT